ncbi:MAG TPA: ROK family transcriptional regulator [Microbacteriaceae bacterium]|jgi:predicted NBD/HSP70 family sugar kinase|nr:ROK family transcriptional regulator [Microbacteriaceae bacterium]
MLSPESPTPVRARNQLLIAEHVQSQRATTRADLARVTGLSRTAVSSLVTELLARGVLVEPDDAPVSADTRATTGRPAVGLSINPAGGALVGIHLAHDGVRIAVSDLASTVLAETGHPLDVDHEPGDTLDYAASAALDLLQDNHIERHSVVGIGVAVAAPITVAGHELGPTTVLRDWAGVDIAARLRERTGAPVFVGNDANLGAIAESRFGAGRGVDDLVYVMLSDGVGAGLILGGRLYEGSAGSAGELGHVTVQPDGQVCRCGNRGCLETVVGTRALVAALGSTGARAAGTDDMIALVEAGHPGAQRVLVDAGRTVGHALAGICTVLNPRMAIVGGKTARAGDPLIRGIRDALSLALPPLDNRSIDVVVGALGDRAELVGALSLAGTNAVAQLLSGSNN